MTKEEMESAYLEYIEDHTNNKFEKDKLPGGIKLALNQLVEIDPLKFNVVNEKLSDMSVTYANEGGGIPKHILNYISPYIRVKSL